MPHLAGSAARTLALWSAIIEPVTVVRDLSELPIADGSPGWRTKGAVVPRLVGPDAQLPATNLGSPPDKDDGPDPITDLRQQAQSVACVR